MNIIQNKMLVMVQAHTEKTEPISGKIFLGTITLLDGNKVEIILASIF